MKMDDLSGLIRGENITIENLTINVNAGDGEMYTAPVQINQTENVNAARSVSAPDDADDYTPRCLYCGWDTSPLVCDDGLYYHLMCKYRDEHPAARATYDRESQMKAWDVVASKPDVAPEHEPVIHQIAAPRKKTFFEEIDERYAEAYAA